MPCDSCSFNVDGTCESCPVCGHDVKSNKMYESKIPSYACRTKCLSAVAVDDTGYGDTVYSFFPESQQESKASAPASMSPKRKPAAKAAAAKDTKPPAGKSGPAKKSLVPKVPLAD